MKNPVITDSFDIELPDLPGNYVLVYHNGCSFEFNHKTLGNHPLYAGWYFYTGSAHGSGGLRSRIHRHLIADAKVHWHIDFLKRVMKMQQVWYDLHEVNQECMITRTIMSVEGAGIPIKGFGASDCHEGCPAHLVSFTQDVSPDLVYRTLGTAGLGLVKKIIF